MLYNRIDEYDCPKWLVWINWEDHVIHNDKTWSILFICEKTSLSLFCFAYKIGKIIRIECESLGEKGECMSRNWPVDENWNKRCNIITQIKK